VRDYRLLLSIAAMLAIPSLFVRPWPPQPRGWNLLDRTGGALLVGLAVARLTALAIDDPGSLTRIPDLLVIRSGVEFWPGVVAGAGSLWLSARRERTSPAAVFAVVAPAAIVAWATYEAMCLVRDGCPGPISSIGLRPRGLVERQFPVALLEATAGLLAAFLLERARRRGLADVDAVLLAIGSIALIRSVASFWLPKVGDGLTRQHTTSILVACLVAVAMVAQQSRGAPAEPR
jgi:hypothetical protein